MNFPFFNQVLFTISKTYSGIPSYIYVLKNCSRLSSSNPIRYCLNTQIILTLSTATISALHMKGIVMEGHHSMWHKPLSKEHIICQGSHMFLLDTEGHNIQKSWNADMHGINLTYCHLDPMLLYHYSFHNHSCTLGGSHHQLV